MGTNYKVHLNTCPTCKRPEETIHIGKSSYGWRFMFNLNGKRYYKDFAGLKKWLKGKVIVDEYGEKLTPAEFLRLVKMKQKEQSQIMYGGGIIDIGGYDFLDCEFS